MAKFFVNHRAGLFLPGAEVASSFGEEVDADVKNSAVAGWVEAGLLVRPKDFRPAKADVSAERLKADLDEANAKVEALQAEVDRLTAELAAAKPAA